MLDPARAKALVVEGDLTLDRKGLLSTAELLPDLVAMLAEGDPLVAVIVTGDLIAPKLVLMEPDYDWSPRFKSNAWFVDRASWLGVIRARVMTES